METNEPGRIPEEAPRVVISTGEQALRELMDAAVTDFQHDHTFGDWENEHDAERVDLLIFSIGLVAGLKLANANPHHVVFAPTGATIYEQLEDVFMKNRVVG